MTLNDYLMAAQDLDDPAVWHNERKSLAKRIYCRDGFHLSVQASYTNYCSPRSNHGPWDAVEVGYPSDVPTEIMEYAENPECPTSTVYGWVPIRLVEQLIESHGGVPAWEKEASE